MQMESSLQRAKELQQKWTVLASRPHLLPVDLVTDLQSRSAAVSKAAQKAIVAQEAAASEVYTHSQQIELPLATLVLNLDDRVTYLEAAVERLEAELARHYSQEGSLFLREMGKQMQNKLARLCVPDIITPFGAKHITLKAIPRRKDVKDLTKYNDVVSQFAGLEEGLAALREVGVETAHPFQRPSKNGQPHSRPVTGDYLSVLFDAHFSEDVETKAHVLSVKECLLTLADELHEPVFVDTATDSSLASISHTYTNCVTLSIYYMILAKLFALTVLHMIDCHTCLEALYIS
jgi:uncharacterized small protein (DUF1192 family)